MRTTLPLIATIALTSFAFAQSTQPTTKPAQNLAPADAVLDRMLKPGGTTAVPLKPATQKIVDKTGKIAADIAVLREGSLVVDRTGRLTRSADGTGYEFSFDADGKAMQDAPMGVLPNLNLANMESAIAAVSRDLRFRVTGTVTEYRGKNYILLDKAVVLQDVTNPF